MTLFQYCVPVVQVLAVADAFVKLGLKAAGYEYVNIDDCWQVARVGGNGTIIEDPVRFPSGIATLTARVHARGLKFGLYTAAATHTCQKRCVHTTAQTHCMGEDLLFISDTTKCIGIFHVHKNASKACYCM